MSSVQVAPPHSSPPLCVTVQHTAVICIPHAMPRIRVVPRAWLQKPSCRRRWRWTTAFARSLRQSSSHRATSIFPALYPSLPFYVAAICRFCDYGMQRSVVPSRCCRWFCSACKLHTPATKCQFITHMPAVLCVHLKRFAWIGACTFPAHHVHVPSLTADSEQNRVKLATHVEFPSILQLNQRWVQAVSQHGAVVA
jgi:hypothetical protein